jgi:diguanylate cyclase (GGDEF)-like protein
VLRVPLGGEDGGAIVVGRPRPFTPDEHNCVDTVGVILTGALRRGRSEAAVRHAAVHDGLTGLPNRELLVQRLEETLATADGPEPVALLFIDLDGFKAVNDRFGHLAGDHVLVEAAARMRAVVREGDFLARFAGDEFALLTTRGSDAGQLAERLRATVAEPFHLDAGTAVIGASIGVAVHDGSESGQHLLSRSDVAMYVSKRHGRDRRPESAGVHAASPAAR